MTPSITEWVIAQHLCGQAWHIESYGYEAENTKAAAQGKIKQRLVTAWTVYPVWPAAHVYEVAAWSHGQLYQVEMVQLHEGGTFTCSCVARRTQERRARARVQGYHVGKLAAPQRGYCKHVDKLCVAAVQRTPCWRSRPPTWPPNWAARRALRSR